MKKGYQSNLHTLKTLLKIEKEDEMSVAHLAHAYIYRNEEVALLYRKQKLMKNDAASFFVNNRSFFRIISKEFRKRTI